MKIILRDPSNLIKKATRRVGDFLEIAEFVKDCLRTGSLSYEIRITLLKTRRDVANEFERVTNYREKHRGFYGRADDMIYLSVRDLNKRVASHEICHVILTKHFKPFIAGAVQEGICQWVERQL